MDLTLASPSTRTLREVVAFLAAEGTPVPGLEPRDEPCTQGGALALAGSEIAGVILGAESPSLRAGESFVFPLITVAAARRRQGVGRRLVEAFAAAPRTAPCVWAIVYPGEGDEIGPRFLRAVGFESRGENLVYERDTVLTWPPRTGPWSIREYAGDDPACDAAIAELHARSYRRQFGVPALSPDAVRQWVTRSGTTCLLAEDGGRVVGCALVNVMGPMAWVGSITVARSHWGTGLADAVHDAVVMVARRQGAERVGGAAHPDNHASQRLMERNGMRVTRTTPMMVRRIGGVDPGATTPG